MKAIAAGAAVLAAAGLAVALSLATAGGAQTVRESAGAFVTRVLREELMGQWARQWDELHPAHKKLITRAQYVACSRSMGTNIGTGAEVFRVLAVENETIDIFAVPQRDSKVVTIEYRSPVGKTSPRYAMHAVAVDGKWTWVLGRRFLAAVARGKCLDGSALQRLPTRVLS